MISFVERRQTTRVPIQCDVKYHYFSPGCDLPLLHTIDLSVGGARLEALDPLVPGAVVWFFLITADKSIVEVGAKVAYLEPGNQPPYRVGVCFSQMPRDGRSVIEREIQRATQSAYSLREP